MNLQTALHIRVLWLPTYHPAPRVGKQAALARHGHPLCKGCTSRDLGAESSVMMHWPELKLDSSVWDTLMTLAVPGSLLVSILGLICLLPGL